MGTCSIKLVATIQVNIMTFDHFSLAFSFEAEKDVLMKRMRDVDDQYSSARDRQSLRVKLRLEKKMLEQEGTFEEAMLILGQASKMGER